MSGNAGSQGVWALLPFKGVEAAKGRLSPLLSQSERAAFALAMARDVLAALAQTRLDGILIVSRAAVARELAAEFGAEVFAESVRGLTAAVTEASAFLADRASGTMIIHGDVPLVTPAEIEAALNGHRQVTLVPDRSDVGTNCVIATPPNAFRYQFDGRSFAPHRALARAAGLEPRVVRLPGLGLDIDTEAALRDFAGQASDTHAWRCLRALGVASRLAATHNPHRH